MQSSGMRGRRVMRSEMARRVSAGVARYYAWHRRTRVAEAASAVAFWIVVAIGPAGLVAINVVGLVIDQQEIAAHLTSLAGAAPGSFGDVIARQFTVIAQPTAGTWGSDALLVVASLWTVSAAVAALLRGIQRGFAQPAGSFLVVRSLGGAVGILAIVSVAVTATILDAQSALTRAVGAVALAIVAFGLVLGIYRVAVGPALTIRQLWPGAAVAAVGLVLIQSVWENIVQASPSLNLTYGALAGIVASLLAIWMAALVVLLGPYICLARATMNRRDHTAA